MYVNNKILGISIEEQAKKDFYNITKDSINNNSLSVLITLLIAGGGIWLVISKLLTYFNKEVLPSVKEYLVTQTKFIKAIDSNSDDIKKTLDRLEENTSSSHQRIIDKLNDVEKDVNEVKVLLSKT
jgi:predicted PurR-regulated permease PerM